MLSVCLLIPSPPSNFECLHYIIICLLRETTFDSSIKQQTKYNITKYVLSNKQPGVYKYIKQVNGCERPERISC
jgi:hypothetical protein